MTKIKQEVVGYISELFSHNEDFGLLFIDEDKNEIEPKDSEIIEFGADHLDSEQVDIMLDTLNISKEQ